MAGRPQRRAREQAAAEMASMIPETTERLRDILADEAPDAIKRIISIAMSPTSTDCLRANIYLVDRVLGTPRPEPRPVQDRLQLAQAHLIEAHLEASLPQAQVRELSARAKIKEVEAEMWPQQFVTEETELQNMQTIAAFINRALMSMTVEEFEKILEGRDPSAALEEFKGVLAVRQADIVEEFMYAREGKGEEDNEDTEDDDDEPEKS